MEPCKTCGSYLERALEPPPDLDIDTIDLATLFVQVDEQRRLLGKLAYHLRAELVLVADRPLVVGNNVIIRPTKTVKWEHGAAEQRTELAKRQARVLYTADGEMVTAIPVDEVIQGWSVRNASNRMADKLGLPVTRDDAITVETL